VSELKQYRISAASAAELVRAIESGVAAGDLRPGERLPSVRRLASDVGLSPVTVASGLAELRRRGVVVTEPRRGSRIGSGPPIGGGLAGRAPLPVPSGARDLSRGNPDPALLPDLGAALSRIPPGGRLYGEAPDLPQLIERAGAQLGTDGIPAESLCVTSGALDAIERVLGVHLRAGDRVAVESPGYAALFDLLRAQGLGLEPVVHDDRGLIPARLAAALAGGVGAVVLTPRGQNPSGAALDGERAGELRAVLAEHPDVLVVEDDHLGPVAGRDLHTVAPGRARWAHARSVAKSLGPDLRLAVLAGDEHTIARVQGRQQCGPGWVSHVLQHLVVALWDDAEVQRGIERASATYTERRTRLVGLLADRGVPARGASGLNVWIEVSDEAAVIGALLQRGWALAPGAPYRLADGRPAVRVTTATLDSAEARRLADDVAEALAPAGWARSG
jgi:DNA-binding transcriptional MocR family regulator